MCSGLRDNPACLGIAEDPYWFVIQLASFLNGLSRFIRTFRPDPFALPVHNCASSRNSLAFRLLGWYYNFVGFLKDLKRRRGCDQHSRRFRVSRPLCGDQRTRSTVHSLRSISIAGPSGFRAAPKSLSLHFLLFKLDIPLRANYQGCRILGKHLWLLGLAINNRVQANFIGFAGFQQAERVRLLPPFLRNALAPIQVGYGLKGVLEKHDLYR